MRRERDTTRNYGNRKGPEISPDRNVQRRAKYAGDPATGDGIREAARARYQSAKPTTRKLANGLLAQGEDREVICGEMDHPVMVESFTITQAAEALGRSQATLRRWLEADKIPAPYLRDTSRGWMVYSVGELEVMARVISQFEAEFNYLISDRTHIVETLQQAVHAYRTEFI